MINSSSNRLFTLLALGALVLTGCAKKEEPEELKGAELLGYIPADTAYAFATLSPLPDDVLDKLEPRLNEILITYQSVLREAVASGAGDDQEMSDEARAALEGFVDELAGLMSIDGMRGAGIARDSMGLVCAEANAPNWEPRGRE